MLAVKIWLSFCRENTAPMQDDSGNNWNHSLFRAVHGSISPNTTRGYWYGV